MMKKVLFMLAVCWMGTSCAAKYGCPYSMTSVEPTQKDPTVTFVKACSADKSAGEPASTSAIPCD